MEKQKVTEKGFKLIFEQLCENMKSKEALDYMLEKFEISNN